MGSAVCHGQCNLLQSAWLCLLMSSTCTVFVYSDGARTFGGGGRQAGYIKTSIWGWGQNSDQQK